MRPLLAALLLVLPLSRARAGFGEFEGFVFERGLPQLDSAVPGRAVCEAKPGVARVSLPDDRAYLMSGLVFDVDGMKIHMAGNKDRGQKYGYYFSFLVEGDPRPVWVEASRQRQDFSLHGRTFHAQVSVWGGIAHHEKIRVKVWNDAGFHRELTTGELAFNDYSSGPALTLAGRVFRLLYTPDIHGDGARVALLETHSLTLSSLAPYQDDGKTYYRPDDVGLVFAARALEAGYVAKDMKTQVSSPRGRLELVYGFRIESGALEVADLTDYSGRGLPPCR